jgi:hypothetical protein
LHRRYGASHGEVEPRRLPQVRRFTLSKCVMHSESDRYTTNGELSYRTASRIFDREKKIYYYRHQRSTQRLRIPHTVIQGGRCFKSPSQTPIGRASRISFLWFRPVVGVPVAVIAKSSTRYSGCCKRKKNGIGFRRLFRRSRLVICGIRPGKERAFWTR